MFKKIFAIVLCLASFATFTGCGEDLKDETLPEYSQNTEVTSETQNNEIPQTSTIGDYETIEFDDGMYLKKYLGDETIVTVPVVYNGITVQGITGACFGENTNIEKVIFPDEFGSIGKYSFARCYKLKEVVLPKNLKTLPNGLFKDCEELATVVMPDSIVDAGRGTFYGCKSLKKIEFNNTSFNEIDMTFAANSGLETFIVPDGVVEISANAFLGCENLKEIYIPASVEVIYSDVFAGCENLTIYAPAGSHAELYAKECNINFVVE